MPLSSSKPLLRDILLRSIYKRLVRSKLLSQYKEYSAARSSVIASVLYETT